MSPVSVTIPVQWGDMDALGHVNNTRYLAWFEAARIAYFLRVGIATTSTPGGGIGPILATTTCDFLVPVVYPATVVVGARATKVGETSITHEYEIRDAAAPDKLYAKGTSVIVMFDYAAGKKVRVPDDVRGAIERLSS
jgi:acyl-CoA thioester hydrolase